MSLAKITQNKIILPLIILVLPILFKSLFIEKLNQYVVNPYLSKIEDDKFLSFFFFSILALFFYDFIIKWKNDYRIETYSFFLLSIIPIIYAVFRFSESWIFSPEKYPFSYLDLIIIYWLFTLIVYLKCLFKKKGIKQPSIDNVAFESEKPIKEIKDDEYGRKVFAKSLSERLLMTKEEDNAFTVGILGKWGSGKTSFLTLIEKHLPQSNKKVIIVKFNPWLFDSKSSLIDDFFSKLKNKLKPYSFELATQISQYAERLTSLESNLFTRFFKIGIGSLYKEKSIDELFEAINNTIKAQDLQIFVFVDDLDRLDHDESVEVIKLIRNTANFSYTTFIVALDKDYLINSLEVKKYYNPKGYLEKIFQLEISLPKRNSSLEYDYIYKKILAEIISEDQKEYSIYFNKGLVLSPNSPITFIKSKRLAKRFINSFLISYSILKGEVDIMDLINLEFLKIKYYKIYCQLLEDNSRRVIVSRGNDFLNLKPTFELKRNSANKKYAIEELLEEQKSKFSTDEIKEIISTLSSLFSGDHSPKSIAHPANFDKYFSLNLLKNGFQENWFSNFRKIEDQKSLNNKIDEFCSKKNEYQLFDRFSRMNSSYHFSDKTEFERLSKALAYLENKYPNYSNNNFLYIFILSGERLYETETDFEAFLKGLLSNPYSLTIGETNLIKSFLNSRFNFPWIKRMLSNYIQKIINESSQFEAIILHQYKILERLIPDKSNPQLTNSKNLILKAIGSDPIGFFKWTLIPTSLDKIEYRIHDLTIIDLFFSNLKSYLMYYMELDFPKSQVSEKKEVIEFLKKYIDYNSKNVPFDFKKIKIE